LFQQATSKNSKKLGSGLLILCETACNRQVFNKKMILIFLFAGRFIQAKYEKERQIDGLKVYAALPIGY